MMVASLGAYPETGRGEPQGPGLGGLPVGKRRRPVEILAGHVRAAAMLLLLVQGCATWTDEYALRTLDEARKLASKTGKPILINFRTTW